MARFERTSLFDVVDWICNISLKLLLLPHPIILHYNPCSTFRMNTFVIFSLSILSFFDIEYKYLYRPRQYLSSSKMMYII